jgi:hypothetical protein
VFIATMIQKSQIKALRSVKSTIQQKRNKFSKIVLKKKDLEKLFPIQIQFSVLEQRRKTSKLYCNSTKILLLGFQAQ